MNPRIINEFEGGPTHIYLGKHPLRHDEDNKAMLFWSINLNPAIKQMLGEQKCTATPESILWDKMPMVTACEECDECECDSNISPCSKQPKEVGDKGMGLKVTEVLEGWFIDLGMCTQWKVCECCKGKGYLI
ncbi:conserved hypothetical protein [Candidatus Desulfosporosinus infrequens]|uniref:Uncharacterized protein n=1 Tax=Candidatus Desulfosporosinus infrequens TaxID=2043169 RepID=A0A2U3LGU2_9FIRM|nr:conserved hypothetical protein [Candidatus Desulfosporosinus infrequens]